MGGEVENAQMQQWCFVCRELENSSTSYAMVPYMLRRPTVKIEGVYFGDHVSL